MEKITDYNHSFLERALVHIILKPQGIKEFLFDVENFYFNKNKLNNDDEGIIFITGLARSGTTAALNAFYDTGDFASLIYEDFPFILAPNIYSQFKKIIKISNSKIFKRAHDDGILISHKSPEAFEEIFWKKELKNNYIKKEFLLKNVLNKEIIDRYRIFISLIKKKNNKLKFISKNNNFVLRANYIIKNFNKSNVLVFFRDPLYQCNSLLKQHKNFLILQKKNNFITSYMNYLGHHEFGNNLKKFDIGLYNEQNPLDLNYWIEQWINYYKYFLNFRIFNNVKFICYEELAEKKNDYLRKKIDHGLIDKINLSNYSCKNNIIFNSKKFSKLDYAYKIYNKLKNL